MGTSRRDSTLRQSCVIRDCHRCVVTRMLDINVVDGHQGDGPIIDYHGNELLLGDRNVGSLEVSHIIPHSLLSFRNVSGAEPRLPEPKRIAFQILKMFNPVAVQELEGSNIDRPRIALVLSHDAQLYFGNFRIAFNRVEGEERTYMIDYVRPTRYRVPLDLPVTVTLDFAPDNNIELPSPELLNIHRAIARIFHLSAAGEYIDKFLEDMDKNKVAENGTSPLDEYVRFKMSFTGNPMAT
ncbi:hypothetical protein V1514DRAFT_115619 [Lipomyces japonicus]|uniref:uncharacterized protein n=1 Tax=Lipomyces japonicus TaxID=56871 RepID=UPI0034CDD06E